MILCITPNPAIDRTLYVAALQVGAVHRASKMLAVAGGKGLNVARAIHTLGGEPLCMGLVGGYAGKLLEDLAQQEGLSAQWTWMRGETRTCIILVQANQDATVINEAGAAVELEAGKALVEDIWRNAQTANQISISGSLPPDFDLGLFEALLSGLFERGKSVWVDTSGQALNTALKVGGICIKVNGMELGEALGVEISTREQATKEIRQLHKIGIPQIAITLGKDGAIFSSGAEVWFGKPPTLEVVSSVGSGDAFLGGLLFALENNAVPQDALRSAIAAGAANALIFGGGKFLPVQYREIFDQVQMFPIRL